MIKSFHITERQFNVKNIEIKMANLQYSDLINSVLSRSLSNPGIINKEMMRVIFFVLFFVFYY